MSWTTLASVKAQGGIQQEDASRDDQFKKLILLMSDVIAGSLHRRLDVTIYTEYYSGDNSYILQLRQYPIISVDTVCIDDDGAFGQASNAFPVARNLVQGDDYAIVSGQDGLGSGGQLRRYGNVWPRWPVWAPGKVAPQMVRDKGNIKVIYTAGYANIPPRVEYAVNAAILQAALMSNVGGAAQSMAYEDASVSLFSPDMMSKVFGSIDRTLGSLRMPVI